MRTKPFKCPVDGCAKRGQRGDLLRHARAKHPEVAQAAYSAALAGGKPLRSPRRWPGYARLVVIGTLFLLAAVTAVLIVAPRLPLLD